MHLANSKKQALDEHLIAVSNQAEYFRKHELAGFSNDYVDVISKSLKFACLFHDVGKACSSFQDYLKSKIDSGDEYQPEIGEIISFIEENPLHHEVSLLVLNAVWRNNKSLFSRDLLPYVKYGVYWHHAEAYRKNTSLDEVIEEAVRSTSLSEDCAKYLCDYSNQLFGKTIEISVEDIEEEISSVKPVDFIDTPLIKENMTPSDIIQGVKRSLTHNVISILVRYFLVKADRRVSQLSPELINDRPILRSYCDESLLNVIKSYKDRHDLSGERTDQQIHVASELADYDFSVCQGGTGAGKTRTALLSYLAARENKKTNHQGILWVCPRVAVGISILNEIKDELPDCKVGIITGSQREYYYQGESFPLPDCPDDSLDIVITTIDQVVSSMVAHGRIENFGLFVNRYVVFDEYHELFDIDSLYWFSLILIRLKELQTKSYLMISATPQPFHLSLALDNQSFKYPVKLPSFNQKPVRIKFQKESQGDFSNALYVFNTATQAQNMALEQWGENKNIACYHSKFNTEDQKRLGQEILGRFGKINTSTNDTLFAGPIAQASLNISRQKLITDISKPDNIIQRIGRCNRFAEYDFADVVISVPDELVSFKNESIKKTGVQKIIQRRDGYSKDSRRCYYSRSSFLFFKYLVESKNVEFEDGSSIETTIDELTDFYKQHTVSGLGWKSKTVVDSIEYLRDVINYVKSQQFYKPVRRIIKDGNTERASVSYRGESYYAIMSGVTIKNLGEEYYWVGEPGKSQTMCSIQEYDIEGIDVEENLKQAPWESLNDLIKSYRYIARNVGYKSPASYLLAASKNVDTPIIASHPDHHHRPGLTYKRLESGDDQCVIGYMKHSTNREK